MMAPDEPLLKSSCRENIGQTNEHTHHVVMINAHLIVTRYIDEG
jgi:hypothetical protein